MYRMLPQVWLPAPSWANHNAIFSAVGLEVGAYAYYDKATCGFDFEGAKADIKVSMNKQGLGVFERVLQLSGMLFSMRSNPDSLNHEHILLTLIKTCQLLSENSRGEHDPAARLRAQPDGR